MPAGVRLDGVHHGIDAGRCGDVRRQPEGQLRIEDRPVGQEARGDDALLLGGGRGHDRDRRHLGARARRGRGEEEWQPLPSGETDPVEVVEPVVGASQVRHELCGIERAAAPDRDHRLDLLLPAERDRGLDNVRGRVGDHVLEHGEVALGRKAGFGIPGQACATHALVSDEQDAPGVELGDKARDLLRRASFEEHVGRGLEGERVDHSPASLTARSKSLVRTSSVISPCDTRVSSQTSLRRTADPTSRLSARITNGNGELRSMI